MKVQTQTNNMRPAIKAGEVMSFYRTWRNEFEARGLNDIQASLAARAMTDIFRKARYAGQDFNASAQERVAVRVFNDAATGALVL